jgi:hypothetical protein
MCAQVRIEGRDGIGDLLQVDSVGRVVSAVRIGDGQRRIRRGQSGKRYRWIPILIEIIREILSFLCLKIGVDRRDGFFMPLLLIVEEEPSLPALDGAADGASKLLQNIQRSADAGGFIDSIVCAGRRVAVVVKAISVEGIIA